MMFNSRFGIKMFGEPSTKFGDDETKIQTQSRVTSVVIATGESMAHVDTFASALGHIFAQGTGLIVIQTFSSASSVPNRIGKALVFIRTFTSIDAIRKRYVSSITEIETSIELDGFLLSWEGEEIPCSDDWIEMPKEPCSWSDLTYAPRQWKQVHG